MNLCIPILKDDGLQSRVSPHFGSAPMFMMIDTDTNAMSVIDNQNAHHEHGMCHPLRALEGQDVDSIIVGGIGAGALNKLLAARIRVYQATTRTVGESLEAFKSGSLQQVDPAAACAGHGHHGHGHHGHGFGPGARGPAGWGYGPRS